MKNVKVCFFLLLIPMFLIPGVVYSQAGEITRRELQDLTKLSGKIVTKHATKTIGSAYLNENFLKGQLILGKNTKTGTIFLRYNMEKMRLSF